MCKLIAERRKDEVLVDVGGCNSLFISIIGRDV